MPEKYIAEELRKAASYYDKTISTIEKVFYPRPSVGISNRGFQLIGQFANVRIRIREQFFRQLRKRLMPADRQTSLVFLIQFLTGRLQCFTDLESDLDQARDNQVLHKMLGLHRARHDRLTGARPWLYYPPRPL